MLTRRSIYFTSTAQRAMQSTAVAKGCANGERLRIHIR
jgi:hypothetical protein